MAPKRPPARSLPGRVIEGTLQPSKLAVACLLLAATVYNCRSPNLLSSHDGDRPADVWVGTTHVTWGLQSQALVLVGLVLWYFGAAGSPARQPWSVTEAVAAVACLAGAALRKWCFETLGAFFTYEVGIRRGHHLVATGPYLLLLHPSYTGTVLLVAGFYYFLGGHSNWFRRPLGLALLAAVGGVVAAMRVTNEEALLAEHFGVAWEQHRATRWRMIPYVF